MVNKKIKCDICIIKDNTPPDLEQHIEGYVCVYINKDCKYHGHYLDLTTDRNNKFSIELVQQLEKKYEETC